MPQIPLHIVRQWPSGLYKDTKTGKVYTLKALQAIYSPKPKQQSIKENEGLIEPKTNWMSNYDNY